MWHRQVVLLICGLMSDPTPIIHYVCERWIEHGQKPAGKAAKDLIGLMYSETGLPVPKDFLHNQWINYYDHRYSLINDTTPIYVPSRSYFFENMKVNISCKIQHRNTEIPECTMSIVSPYPSLAENLLSICHRICQHQAARNLHIRGVICEDLPEPHVFTVSKNTESIKIISCELSIQTLRHLVQQINGCDALRVLNISRTILIGCISGFLPEPHPGLPELKELHLTDTALNKDDLQHLLSMAHKLPKLHILNLSHNTLTGCLSGFLPDPHPGLPSLELLNLDRASLNKEDLYHLLSIAHKLPKLQKLDLSRNTVTRCLSSFLPDPHLGLPELETIDLTHTEVNIEDQQHISHITQSNKLPKLRGLNLSETTLTGCLSNFLPDSYPGLPKLESLYLWKSKLSKDDLQHLTHLIQTQKLPALNELHLEDNMLCEMETDVERLIEACVNHHQKELKLGLWFNNLSVAFKEKWKQRSAGTKIELAFSF